MLRTAQVYTEIDGDFHFHRERHGEKFDVRPTAARAILSAGGEQSWVTGRGLTSVIENAFGISPVDVVGVQSELNLDRIRVRLLHDFVQVERIHNERRHRDLVRLSLGVDACVHEPLETRKDGLSFARSFCKIFRLLICHRLNAPLESEAEGLLHALERVLCIGPYTLVKVPADKHRIA